jgi:hypothetical protein
MRRRGASRKFSDRPHVLAAIAFPLTDEPAPAAPLPSNAESLQRHQDLVRRCLKPNAQLLRRHAMHQVQFGDLGALRVSQPVAPPFSR